MITYEEFKALVRESLAKDMKKLTTEQLEEYINGEEAEEVIKNRYDLSIIQFENGEITEKIFRNGNVSAVAYCLYMLY